MQCRSSKESNKKAWNNTKKKTLRYYEQKEEQAKEYLGKTAGINKENIVYIDETGINSYLYHEYAYAERGKKVYGKIKGRKFKRTNIVAAKYRKQIIAPIQYDTTMTGEFFEGWFERILLPVLPKDAVIVMDNASFHRKKQLDEIAGNNNITLIFLPPYSPELNPIEKVWANMKKFLRNFLLLMTLFIPFFKLNDYNTCIVHGKKTGKFFVFMTPSTTKTAR